MNPRAVASKHLKKILCEDLLWEPSNIEHDKAPAIRHYCFGVLRFYHFLEHPLKKLLSKPLKDKDADIKALLLIGLYELWTTPDKAYAIVDESVKAALALKKPWAKGLVNAVLRNFIRQRDDLLSKINEADALSHPNWLVKAFKKAWPDNWQMICEQNNQHPAMTLRVNHQQTTREAYLKHLAEMDIEAKALPFSEQAIVLAKPQDVHTLPGFDNGIISVQDQSAQLAASLLEISPNQRILDACAAPGGKCAHMLELEPTLDVHALELNPKRAIKLEQTLNRLKLKAKVIVQDATKPQDWWDKQLYDRILLDAPCTGTGVIARHPDIKLHLTRDKVEHAVETQKQLLTELWPLLKPGGMLVYSTCSVLPQENEQQIEDFL